MEIVIGLIAYTAILFFLLSYGRFFKECDNSLREYFSKGDLGKSTKAVPTPSNLTTAVLDIQSAYTDADCTKEMVVRSIVKALGHEIKEEK